ncbi:hypothetical protein RYX36_003932, partial [Vicia faba]
VTHRNKSYKSGGSKDNRDKDEGSTNRLERVYPIEGDGDVQTRNRKLAVSSSIEDNLETKMVDPTSYMFEFSTIISSSKDESTTSESTVCSMCKEADFKSRAVRDMVDTEVTSRCTPDKYKFSSKGFDEEEVQREKAKPEDFIKSIMSSEYRTLNDKEGSTDDVTSTSTLDFMHEY